MSERIHVTDPEEFLKKELEERRIAEDAAAKDALKEAWYGDVGSLGSAALQTMAVEQKRVMNKLGQMDSSDETLGLDYNYDQSLRGQESLLDKFGHSSMRELARRQAELESKGDRTAVNDLRDQVILPRLAKQAKSMIEKGASNEVVTSIFVNDKGQEKKGMSGETTANIGKVVWSKETKTVSREEHLINRFDKLVEEAKEGSKSSEENSASEKTPDDSAKSKSTPTDEAEDTKEEKPASAKHPAIGRTMSLKEFKELNEEEKTALGGEAEAIGKRFDAQYGTKSKEDDKTRRRSKISAKFVGSSADKAKTRFEKRKAKAEAEAHKLNDHFDRMEKELERHEALKAAKEKASEARKLSKERKAEAKEFSKLWDKAHIENATFDKRVATEKKFQAEQELKDAEERLKKLQPGRLRRLGRAAIWPFVMANRAGVATREMIEDLTSRNETEEDKDKKQ